jgi:hypothetical protein
VLRRLYPDRNSLTRSIGNSHALGHRIQQSRRAKHRKTGGFALSPQTMPILMTRGNGIVGVVEPAVKSLVFNRQCDPVSIRPRAFVLYGPLVAARNLK